jgi:hypothetical protein
MSATTPLIVRGYSLSGPALGHLFVPYVYGGTERTTKRPKPTTDRICTLDGCERQKHAKGYCGSHYQKFVRGVQVTVDNRLRPFEPSTCGTTAGYKRHLNHGVPLCQACRDAKNRYDRERRARTGAKK